jgi:hypothetical protein
MRKIIGELRKRKGFLFLPKRIHSELRWLEYARWTEKVDSNFTWLPIYWDDE